MSLLLVIGCIIWILALIFSLWENTGIPIKYPLLRIFFMILLLPIFGVSMVFVGVLGLVFISPVMYLLGYEILVKFISLN